MSRYATLKWLSLALVGLLIAGGVAVAGSRLASRQIGLASEPINAGDALAPRASKQPSARNPAPADDAGGPTSPPPPESTIAPPESTIAPPESTSATPAPEQSPSDTENGGDRDADD